MQVIVAIVGQPNTGKSTLFNRLTRSKQAIVHNTPGVTRDRQEAVGYLGDLEFMVIDTPGLEEGAAESLAGRMAEQTKIAIKQANLVLMLVDGKVGITPGDKYFARWLRGQSQNIVLVVNKCETKHAAFNAAEFYELGFGEPICISAEHGAGLAELYDALSPLYKEYSSESEMQPDTEESKPSDDIIKITVVGRPNSGKSTFINSLLGDDRLLTGMEAGITRDAINLDWQYAGRGIRLVDTAGMRRKSNIHNDLEQFSVNDSINAIRRSNIVILLLNAECPLEAQDLTIANLVINEGKGLVIAVNKSDIIEDKELAKKQIKYKLEHSLAQLKNIPVVYLSALHKDNIHAPINAAISLYDLWNKKINTAKLNDWLSYAVSSHLPPLSSARKPVKFKYITQKSIRPPTFVLFTNNLEVDKSYIRYLTNSLRDHFDLPGVPIRLLLRKNKNPYS